MSDKRLSALAILSIRNSISQSLNFSEGNTGVRRHRHADLNSNNL